MVDVNVMPGEGGEACPTGCDRDLQQTPRTLPHRLLHRDANYADVLHSVFLLFF